jgi:hypothetical protein
MICLTAAEQQDFCVPNTAALLLLLLLLLLLCHSLT